MESVLPDAIATLVAVFHHYSGQEGDKFKLNKKELKNLITEQLPDCMTNNHDPETVEKLMNDLDENQDSEVDFMEFLRAVGFMALAYNEFFTGYTLELEAKEDEQKKE